VIPSVPDVQVAPVLPRNDRLIALFLLGTVAVSPLLLRVFGVSATVFGWPLLFVYMFVVWAALVLLTALDVERRPPEKPKKDRGAGGAVTGTTAPAG